ncbi:MAG TPA: YqgE/AlgH family protein, partial [Wenzhouxiangella sp.]|nr:YqgE/AlgH family protein [Wenzhouxiangella sp.]
LDMQLGEILAHMEVEAIDPDTARHPVFQGGPVQTERGFVLHEPLGDWEATLQIDTTIGVTASQDILAAMAVGRGPRRALVALGYAGWESGQLEDEMRANAWLNVMASADIIFDSPVDQRWEKAVARLGIDVANLQPAGGHA